MSSTYYHFIPCLREGLTTVIETTATAKRVEIDVKLHGEARNKSTGQYEPFKIPQKVQLYGPGDVLGFSSRVVTRTEPKNNAGNFEPNYFPFIEFAEPDFLWRFTPKKADDGHGSLDPWVTLIVLIAESEDKEFTEVTQAGTADIPRISKISKVNLPDLAYAWQWAHAQVTHESDTLNVSDLTDILRNHPERAVCRLMCARRLRPKTLYHAFVVPTFRLGLVAAGIPDDGGEEVYSWVQDGSAEEITLPYYYKWEFRTSVRGDFEYLVRLLEPREIPGLGTRSMDCEIPGYGITGIDRSGTGVPEDEAHVLKLEGALQSLDTEYTAWGNDSGAEPPALETFQEEIADKLLNKPARDLGSMPDSETSKRFTYTVEETDIITNISLKLQSSDSSVRFEWNTARESISRIEYGLTSDNYEPPAERPVLRTTHVLTLVDLKPHNRYYFKISATDPSECVKGTFDMPELPSVVPPIYGKWHRAQAYVDTSKPDEWLSALNLDPRHRAAAGLGAMVIKKQQEALMASAWEQIGDVLKANKMLRQAQVGRDTGKHLHNRMKDLLLERFLYFSAPVQKRVTMENPCSADDSSQPKKISIDQFIKKNTEIPKGIMDPAFRRISRVRGPIRKRQKRSPLRNDLLTRLAEGTLEPTGPNPRPGGMFTPCMISHILSERMPDLVPPLPENYSLTVNAGEGGTVEVILPPSSAPYAAGMTIPGGQIVSITAKASENYDFIRWSGPGTPIDGSTDESVSFTMNGNYSITAVFLPEEHVGPIDTGDGVGDLAGTGLSAGVNPTPPSAPGDTAGLTGSSDRGLQPEPGPAVTISAPPSGTSASGGVIPGTSQGNATLFCEDKIKDINVAQFIEKHKPFSGIDSITDPMPTAEAVEDALKNWLNKVDPKEPKKIITRETLEKIRGALDAELVPERAITERVKQRLRLTESIADRFAEGAKGDPLDVIMAAPEFPQPMYEPLRDLSQDYLLPGVETVQQNTIAILKTNRRFMESYMVGCNHEFAGELLWRRYPTDQRGSYFRQFWDVSEYIPKPDELDENGKLKEDIRKCLHDIESLHRWRSNAVGQNAVSPEDTADAPDADSGSGDGQDASDNIVLLVRGDLLNRYPNTAIYAVDAINIAADDAPAELRPALDEFLEGFLVNGEKPQAKEPYSPLFKGTLSPDITFLGFPFTEVKARGTDGGHGVFFILEERVSETRFGLDDPNDDDMQSWDDLCWNEVGLGADADIGRYIGGKIEIEQPSDNSGKTWSQDSSSAQRAWITMQKPVRIAIHSSQMLPE